MDKKGVLASQMTWIFILIAGAFIFFITFKVINLHTSLSNEKLAVKMASIIKADIDSFSTSQNAYSTIQTFGGSVYNSCDGIVVNSYQKLPIFVFSRSTLSSDSGLWNLFIHPFQLPIRSSNIVTIVDPKTIFVFVYNPHNSVQASVASRVVSLLPSQNETKFPVRILNFSDLQSAFSFADSNSDYNINIISFVKPVSSVQISNPNIHLYYVEVFYENFQYDAFGNLISAFGNVSFYNFSRNGLVEEGTLPFFGFPLLTAFVSSDYDISRCNLLKLLQQDSYTLIISAGRLSLLKSSFPECSQNLDDTVSDVYSLNKVLNVVVSHPEDINNYLNRYSGFIWKKSLTVEADNNALLQDSCPTLY